MTTDDGPQTMGNAPVAKAAVNRRPSLVYAWPLFTLLAAITVWSVVTLATGIEMRAFQQPIHNGDPNALTSPLLAQSFVSTRDNLSRVEIRLAQPPTTPVYGASDLLIELRQGDGPDGTLLYEARLGEFTTLSDTDPAFLPDASQIISDAGISYLSFAFPPIASSAGISYTFALQRVAGRSPDTDNPVNDELQLAYSPIDALSSGTMYTQSGPQPGDLTIATYYSYNLPTLLADTSSAIAGNLLNIFAWLALFFLPGLALLMWIPNGSSAGQKLLAAPGLSVLSVPLIYLAASLVGFPLGPGKVWIFLAFCALAIIAHLFLYERNKVASRILGTLRNPQSLDFWITFVLIVGITAATRLISLRDVPSGEGMDAYHHTMITALFLRDTGIPTGYAPFAPLASFTYHFGFHSLTATLAWLTNSTQITDLMALVPRVGQITSSVLPIPALVLFGWRALGSRWLGLTAGAFAGLLSVVPAFYGEWSRYTQGQGLAVLPIALLFFMEMQSKAGSIPSGTKLQGMIKNMAPSVVLAVISAAGIFLTHYRITVIYAGFAALYVAWRALIEWKSLRAQGESPQVSRYVARIVPFLISGVVTACITLLVLTPWLLNLSHNFVKNFIDKSGLDIDVYFATAERLSADVLGHPSLPILAGLGALGLVILGWRTWRSPRAGMAVGLIAGLPAFLASLYIYSNPNTIALEKATQTTIVGLSPVTWLLLLAIVALVVLLIGVDGKDRNDRRYREALVVLPVLTWLILELWSSPQLLPFRLPLVGYLDAVTLTSSAWLPACILAGYATMKVWELIAANTHLISGSSAGIAIWRPALLGLTALLLALASGMSLSPVNDRTPYIATADMNAFAWMRANLPQNSYVLSNAFNFAWSPTQMLGFDAGLWLPLTTGLRSSIPPIAAYNEKPSDPTYFTQAQVLAAARPLLPSDPSYEANWQQLKTAGITDIYIGSRSAGDGYSVPTLLNDPHVQLLFHQDGVWLFKLR